MGTGRSAQRDAHIGVAARGMTVGDIVGVRQQGRTIAASLNFNRADQALIATAIGLFAAIPAVIAYNRYADQVSRLELRYDAFMEEFSTILQRYAGHKA